MNTQAIENYTEITSDIKQESRRKWTPGPWCVDDPNSWLVAVPVDGVYEYVANCDPGVFSATKRSDNEIDANAQLIAAAPCMDRELGAEYEFLLNLLDEVESRVLRAKIQQRIEAIIDVREQARGETQ